jgi:hypothetical protein
LAFNRDPSTQQLARAIDFIHRQEIAIAESRNQTQESLETNRRGALVDFCHALFNSNEFIYVD